MDALVVEKLEWKGGDGNGEKGVVAPPLPPRPLVLLLGEDIQLG